MKVVRVIPALPQPTMSIEELTWHEFHMILEALKFASGGHMPNSMREGVSIPGRLYNALAALPVEERKE